MKPAAIALFGLAAAVAATAMFAAKSPPKEPRLAGIENSTVDTMEQAKAKGRELATIAGGCFWCTEDDYRRVKGVLATDVGYIGGKVKNPTYKQVCTGLTGHAEATRIEFDPKVISYRGMLDAFFKMHDPTQGDRQGLDVGSQYRSVIFYHTPEQKTIAEQAIKDHQKKLKHKITTTVVPATVYYRAEEYHQQYYQKKRIDG